jgi:hypothetical protein
MAKNCVMHNLTHRHARLSFASSSVEKRGKHEESSRRGGGTPWRRGAPSRARSWRRGRPGTSAPWPGSTLGRGGGVGATGAPDHGGGRGGRAGAQERSG